MEARVKYHLRIAFVAVALTALGLSLYLTAPTAEDFSWSDAPRHALNGIFVHDLLTALPFSDPKGFAINYYLQYPALTILFYPPLFYLFLAGAYGLFGFSHAVAQATVCGFHVLLALGVYMLARRWMTVGYAISAAVLLTAAPEVAYWGRQVMLDIPAYAWLALTAWMFVRYLEQKRPAFLYLTVLLYLAALYTKQTPLFVAGALALGLLAERGMGALRDRHVWAAAGMFLLLLVPLVVLQVKFGQVNIASVAGSLRHDAPRTSAIAWVFYLEQLPRQLGWPTVILAAVYLVGAALRPDWRLPRGSFVFLLSWFCIGYLFFSYIMVREPRHDLMILLPLPIFAVLAVRQVLAGTPPVVGASCSLALAASTLVASTWFQPVQYVRGYDEAARYVLKRAPEHSNVLFDGYRDGNFVFSVRAGARHDIGVLRADKLLLRVVIERARGVEDRGIGEAAIEDMLRRYRVRYVVAQTGFWTDLPSTRALQMLLGRRDRFLPVARIVPEANFPHEDMEVVIYEYLGAIADRAAPLSLEMVGIGQQFNQKKAPQKP